MKVELIILLFLGRATSNRIRCTITLHVTRLMRLVLNMIGNAKIMKKLFPNFLKILQSTSACIFHKLSLRILNHSDALKISRNLGDKPLCSFLVRI